MKKLLAVTILAGLSTAGFSNPALASSEVRLKTDAITIWVPKVIKAPRTGCSQVPVRFRWRNYYSTNTGAVVTLYDKKDFIVGDVEIDVATSESRGLVTMKICAERWVDENGIPVFPVKRGRQTIDVWIIDDGNHKGLFQDAAKRGRVK